MFVTRFDLETTYNVDDISVLAPVDTDHLTAQEKAIGKAKSFIQHRYDPDEVFITVNNYNAATTYAINDFVYYNKKYYTCILESTGNLPTNTTYFTEGDTRDPNIVDIVVILTVFNLYKKVPNRVYPEKVQDDYDLAIEELKAYEKGTRTILLTVQTDADDEEEGHRISYDSETQKDWNF
jgi:hypothetical protein